MERKKKSKTKPQKSITKNLKTKFKGFDTKI